VPREMQIEEDEVDVRPLPEQRKTVVGIRGFDQIETLVITPSTSRNADRISG